MKTCKGKILYVGAVPFELGGRGVGGIETHCWQLAVQASKSGYKVHILTYGSRSSREEKDGITIINISRGQKKKQ